MPSLSEGHMATDLLTRWREPEGGRPGITEVFLAALGVDGKGGFQCELGFGDTTTKSYRGETLWRAVRGAWEWASVNYPKRPGW